jgi:hemolysin activation/secretion protein
MNGFSPLRCLSLPASSMQTLRSLARALVLLPALALGGGIRFEGNSALSTAALDQVEVRLIERGGRLFPDPAGEPYRLGALDASRLSPEGVTQVVRAVSAFYQAQGILATRAQVSRDAFAAAQAGGDLLVEVIEGRIDVVRVAAAEGGELSPGTRGRILAASPVRVGGAIDGRALEQSLASLNRFSAARVQPVLFAEPEGIVLEYRVAPAKPWFGGYTVDNFGSTRTGEVRHSLEGGLTGIATDDDRLSLTAILTSGSGSRYVRGEYFLPLGPTLGHRLRLSAYHASYQADDIGVAAFDFEGESTGLVASYETTLWGEGTRFLDLSLGFHYVEASQDQSSVGIPSASSGFFLPFVDLKLSQQSPGLSWVAGARLETNLPDLGGTADAAELGRLGRYLVSDEFTLLRLYGGVRAHLDTARVHEILLNGAYVTSLGGDRLPASFLQVVGGHATVRGYRVAAISGDRGAHAQFEYRFHVLRLARNASGWGAAFAAFYDLGAVENEDPLPFEFDDTLSSYGVGLHLNFLDRFRASVEYARVLADLTRPFESVESGDNEVYLKASVQF